MIFHPQTKESQSKEFSSFATTKSFSWTEMRQLSFCLARSNTFFFSLSLTFSISLTLAYTHTLSLSDSARNEDMGKNDVKTLLLHFVDLILEENTLMVHFDFPKAFLGGSRTQALGSQRKPNEHLILFFNRILVSPMSSQVTIREITFSEFRSISFFEKKLSSL